MRASATSRISSAHLPPAQNKPDTKSGDAASPFELLVQEAAPKEAAKPSQKDSSSPDNKSGDDRRAARQDDKAAAPAQQQPAQTSPTAKAEKPRKDDDKTDTQDDDAKAVDSATEQVSQVSQVSPPPVTIPVQPPAQPDIALVAVPDDKGDTDHIAAASDISDSKAPQPASDAKAAVPAPPAPTASNDGQTKTAGATPGAAPADKSVAAAPNKPAPPVSNDDQTGTANAAPGEAPADKSITVMAAAPNHAAPDAPNNDNTQAAQGATQAAPSEALADTTVAAKPDAKPKTDIAKADAKPGDIKVARTSNAGKSDAATAAANAPNSRPDAPAETKPDTTYAALSDKAAATPEVALRSPGADANPIAVSPLIAPQPQGPGQVAGPTMHVQVTESPAPNLAGLAVEIVAKSLGGAKQFDIRLDPPELGRVEVRLSIDAAGKASAHLSADQPQTLDLLQKDASSLTRALREAGLDVSQNGLNFSLRHQNHDGGGNAGGNGHGASRAFSATATPTLEATATSASWRGTADGRLDIRV